MACIMVQIKPDANVETKRQLSPVGPEVLSEQELFVGDTLERRRQFIEELVKECKQLNKLSDIKLDIGYYECRFCYRKWITRVFNEPFTCGDHSFCCIVQKSPGSSNLEKYRLLYRSPRRS